MNIVYGVVRLGLVMLAMTLGANFAQAQDAGTDFTTVDSATWQEHADKALGFIERDLKETGHVITGNIVRDPDENGIVYFATARDNGPNGRQLSLFRYDENGGWFWREARQDDNAAGREWNAIGYDNGRVVLVEQAAGAAAEECAQPVIVGNDDGMLYSVPDDNLQDDMTWKEPTPIKYPAPANVLEEARNAQSQCEQDNSPQPEEEPAPQ